MGKIVPKRKQWAIEEEKGSKRVKAEVKSTQTEDSPDGISNEAYELMVKGRSTLLTWHISWLVFPISLVYIWFSNCSLPALTQKHPPLRTGKKWQTSAEKPCTMFSRRTRRWVDHWASVLMFSCWVSCSHAPSGFLEQSDAKSVGLHFHYNSNVKGLGWCLILPLVKHDLFFLYCVHIVTA